MIVVCTLNEIIIFLLWVIPVIILHELGHYLAYRLFKIKPKLKFHWWGITVGSEEDGFRLSPLKTWVILWAGMLSGYFYTILFNNQFYLFIYFIFCVQDGYNVYHTMLASYKKYKNMGLYAIDLYRKEYEKMIETKKRLGL